MGCRPASQVQQTAFHTAMDNHMPKMYRHRIALYTDDMAVGADTLEELFVRRYFRIQVPNTTSIL